MSQLDANLLEQRSDFNMNTLFALRKTLSKAQGLTKNAPSSKTTTDKDQLAESSLVIFTDNCCKTYIKRIQVVNESFASDSQDANGLQTSIQTFAENLHNMQYKHDKDKLEVLKKSNAIVADLRSLKGKIIKEGLA
ncbi:hypothetical protein ACO0QE_000960 [Hanseniaspora vineae]